MAAHRVEVRDARDAPRTEAKHGESIAVADDEGSRERVGAGDAHAGHGEVAACFENSGVACVVRVVVRDVPDDHRRVVDVAQGRGNGRLLAQRVAKRRVSRAFVRHASGADRAFDVQEKHVRVGRQAGGEERAVGPGPEADGRAGRRRSGSSPTRCRGWCRARRPHPRRSERLSARGSARRRRRR